MTLLFFVLVVNSVLCIAYDIVNTIVSVIVSTIVGVLVSKVVNIIIIVMITMGMVLSSSYYYCTLDHSVFLASLSSFKYSHFTFI